MFSPVSAATRSQNSGPSRASRTAAVAAIRVVSGRTPSSTAAKRRSAVMAMTTPSDDSLRVVGRSRPRPASTFSL